MEHHVLDNVGTHNLNDTYGRSFPNVGVSTESVPTKGPPAKKAKSKIFLLSRGYIRFKPGSTGAEKMQIRQQREKAAPDMKDKVQKIIPDTWLFFNDMLMGKAIGLYGNQALRLFKNLPFAYKAFLEQDTSYYFVVDETKTQKLTLEVYTYKDKLHLSMKKMFKPDDKADDPDQEWIPTGHFVSFDPLEDDPDEMKDFVLMSNEN